MADKFVFRKVRGHIVRIKVKDQTVNVTHRTVQGVGEAAAGAAVASFAGHRAHQFLRKAAEVESIARLRQTANAAGQLSLFKSRGTEKLFKLSTSLHRGRNLALVAGGVVGGALITKGVHDIIKDNKQLQKHPEVAKASTVAGGFGLASTVAAAAYGKKLMPTASLKKVIEYAKARKTIQYTLKGL